MRLLLATLLLPAFFYAQNDACNFQLLLLDTVSADGWNGGDLTIFVDDAPTTYTLRPQDGRSRRVFFPVDGTSEIRLSYDRGPFPEEHGFRIFDNNDSLVYSLDSPPAGTLPGFSATCVDCAAPAAATVRFLDTRTNRTRLVYGASKPGSSYEIFYGVGDSLLTDSLVTTQTEVLIDGLRSDTVYTFFLRSFCNGGADTTALRGPFTLVTPKAVDVGITLVESPVTSCDRSSQPLTVGITNFGGEAQAFFNVGYSIDGVPVEINRPIDGVFTGVIGVDSTEFFTFDNPFVFPDFGQFQLQVYTELEGDEDVSNDTLDIAVSNVPLIESFPYFENFDENDGSWNASADGRNAASWMYDTLARTRGPGWATNPNGFYNNNELSYLNSPCFDFSGFEEPPLFSCLLSVDTEDDFDFVYLESSVDNGENWDRVNSGPASRFWYNDLVNQHWEGDGGLPGGGPAQVSTSLAGLEGEEQVRLRFVFVSSRAVTRPGIVVDNVSIARRFENDLVATLGQITGVANCLDASNPPILTVTNQGTAVSDSRTVTFLIDGNFVATDTFSDPLLPNRSVDYSIPEVMLTQTSDAYVLTAIVKDTADANASNDTVRLGVDGFTQIPALVDLADPTDIPADYVFFGDQGDSGVRTTNFGVVEMGDELVVATGGGSILNLTIAAIADCLEPEVELLRIDTVDTDSIFVVDLSALAGSVVSFNVVANTDDPNFGYRSIAVRRCGGGLDLDVDIIDNGGFVNVIPDAGLAPYIFDFDGDVSAESDREDLEVGDYTVVVTDALGCRDTAAFTIDRASSLDDPAELRNLRVFPNPTADRVNLSFELPEAQAVTARLFTVTGSEVSVYDFGRARSLSTQLDLSALPTGVYLLRLRTPTGTRTLRLVRR